MQLNGNILILGDSFCQNPNGWPRLLCDKFIYNHCCTDGIGGDAWWGVRRRFLNHANQDYFQYVKLLVFIHTQRDRLFTHTPDVSVRSNNPNNQEHQAVELYYKYIYDSAFARWAENQWHNELTRYCVNIPHVVHLFFDSDHSNNLPGICVPTGLLNLALTQHNSSLDFIDDGTRGFINHFSPENNIIFARQLYEIIAGDREDFDIDQFKNTIVNKL